MRTMGPAKVDLPPPDKYLKKHSKEPKLPEKTDSSKDPRSTHFCSVRKPAVPARTERPLMGIPSKKDFRETTVAVPKKPQPIQVDSSHGHRERLENSGLVPKYIMKNDYGKTPVYLQKRKEAEQTAQEHDRLVKEEGQHRAIQRLPDEERQRVLEALKKEWDTYMQMYQKIPFLMETPSQKAHKIELEKRMDELEKKISLIERFKTIYITNDEISHCGDHL
ncbi:enkurin isoform X2 [Melanotaenia boesemani]|nr:enkurin isoform X2 [Melanotaenia boesemani]